MTTVELPLRPRLRPEVVLGPAQRRADGVVHHVKDPVTGRYYRIGPREHFLLSRMDGQRSTEEIGAEYAQTFGRRLGPESWRQVFAMLYQRRLLAGSDDSAALAEAAEAAAREAARNRRTLLLARVPLFDPQRLFDRVGPHLSALFSWWFVGPALVICAVLLGFVGYHWRELVEAVGASRSAVLPMLLALPTAWVIVFVHECAHGLTCWRFGGQVREIGLLWRFPLLGAYCNVDDVVLLSRRRRVATAFAGVFSTLLVVVPFAVLWLLAPDGPVRDLAGTILLFGAVTAAVNLVPFLRLDGYYMLTHALNLVDLRGDTYRFWQRLLRGGPAAVAGYQRRDRIAYGLYGLATVAFAGTVLTLLVRLWYGSLRVWVGPVWAVLILATEGVLVTLFLVYAVRRARRRRAGASGGQTTTSTA
ncbi:MAG TPA: M50 family metallopeptidase [Micromonosporaceae bacterium]